MIKVTDLLFSPQGTSGLDIEAFDCGRTTVNEFFTKKHRTTKTNCSVKPIIFVCPTNLPSLWLVLQWPMPVFSPKGYPIRDKRKSVLRYITVKALLIILLYCWHSLALMSTTKATILAPRLSISLLHGSRAQATSRAAGTLSLMPTTSLIYWTFTNATDSTFSFLLLSKRWNTATGTWKKTAPWRPV